MSKEIEAKEVVKLEDGIHLGVIIEVEDRVTSKGYEYTDIWIESENTKVKSGYSSRINDNSGLGKLLKRFGISIVPGKKYDVGKLLIGKKIQFVTNDDGEFVNVVRGTEKPTNFKEEIIKEE